MINPYQKTGVIACGYTVAALRSETQIKPVIGNRDWHHVAWGTSEMPGRLPMAAYLTLKLNAEIIFFGTGASQVDGMWEAEFSRNHLLVNFDNLYSFELFKEFNDYGYQDRIYARNMVFDRSEIDISCQNTYEEIYNALRSFAKQDIKNAVIVSNPSHTPRISKLASVINRSFFKNHFIVMVVPCVSDFADKDQTLIFEPRSGPGRLPKVNPIKVFGEFSEVPTDKQPNCLKEIQAIIVKHIV